MRLFVCLSLFVFFIYKLDHFWFKKNHTFALRKIYLPPIAHDPLSPPLSPLPWETICNQPFTYLNRGLQSYVFCSEDGKYILKLFRFPSRLWVPFFSHRVEEKRELIKKALASYQLAWEHLRDESGLLYLQFDTSNSFHEKITLQDDLGFQYKISLDRVPFLLQKRAEPFFPFLEKCIAQEGGENALRKIFNLVSSLNSHHISDEDPILEKNYGWCEGEPIFLDVGSFCLKQDLPNACEKTTWSLKHWLSQKHPELLQLYDKLLETYK